MVVGGALVVESVVVSLPRVVAIVKLSGGRNCSLIRSLPKLLYFLDTEIDSAFADYHSISIFIVYSNIA